MRAWRHIVHLWLTLLVGSAALAEPRDESAAASIGVCNPDSWCWTNPLPIGHQLLSLWPADANNLWAVGVNGVILRWNGARWFAMNSSIANRNISFLRIWGLDAQNIWAVGENGTIQKW